jgi:hypothetical protein
MIYHHPFRLFHPRWLPVCFFCAALCASGGNYAYSQTDKPAAKPEPDVLILVNGDKLTGQLENSTGASVVFKSDMAGEVTIDWAKVKELHTNRQFAVIPKEVKIKRKGSTDAIPQGSIQLADQKVEVAPAKGGAAQSVATGDISHVIDEPSFENALTRRPGFTEDWVGTATLGTTLVEATQKNNTISGGISLVRAIPAESWLDPSSRTLFDFNAAYGKLSQPNTPTIKTDLWHLDLEQDQYLTSRLFAFGALAYDHNFSQGLDLQQTYGGGLGFTVIKNPLEEFDVKASMNYIRQEFAVSSLNQNLIGSTFGEDYMRKLVHGIVFTEAGSYTPAWNNTNAYSATAQAGLTFPVYKGFGFSVGALDTFLNNPPPGFKKNSVQFTTALSYAIK